MSKIYSPLSRSRRRRQSGRSIFAMLSLFAYLATAGIVPPGHMAASLDSGTPFHLCPDDARSAVIMALLASYEPSGPGQQHDQHAVKHGHLMTHGAETHEDSGDSVSTGLSESACFLAGAGAVPAANSDLDEARVYRSAMLSLPRPQTAAFQAPAWLRPLTRSPPA